VPRADLICVSCQYRNWGCVCTMSHLPDFPGAMKPDMQMHNSSSGISSARQTYLETVILGLFVEYILQLGLHVQPAGHSKCQSVTTCRCGRLSMSCAACLWFHSLHALGFIITNGQYKHNTMEPLKAWHLSAYALQDCETRCCGSTCGCMLVPVSRLRSNILQFCHHDCHHYEHAGRLRCTLPNRQRLGATYGHAASMQSIAHLMVGMSGHSGLLAAQRAPGCCQWHSHPL
jgi:hypothetical protein